MAVPDLDIGALLELVRSRLGGEFFLPHNTHSNPLVGGEYDVYMLIDEVQSRRIAVRIPKASPGPITTLRLEKEVEMRRRIDEARIQRFQPLLGHDATADNPIGRPYMLLGWADGSPLVWSGSIPQCQTKRQGVLRAIADTNLDLLRQGATALDWINGKIDRRIARAEAGHLPHGTVSECEKQKSLMSRYWIPEMDDAPHVMVHGDLSGNNIIVDENCEVTSVIDLGWAEMIPLQFAAEYPRFIAREPVETDSGFSWTHQDDAQLHEDRAYYLACVKERAEREGGLTSLYYLVLSREDELNRHWWYTAAGRVDIHRAMAKCDWDPKSRIDQGRADVG